MTDLRPHGDLVKLKERMPQRKHIAGFFCIVLILCSWHLDDGPNDNTMARAASVASLVDRGTLEITPIHTVTDDKSAVEGRYYSDKAPLPTFLVLPFHWLCVKLGLVTTGVNGSLGPGLLRLGGLICGSIPLSIMITIVWVDLRRTRTMGPWPASLLATLPFLGSFLFVYSGSFYNHLLGALFALLAARSVQRQRAFHAGLFSGAAFLCDAALLLFAIVWAAQLWYRVGWKAVFNIAIGLAPAVLLSAANNMAVTGSPFTFPSAYSANYSAMHSQYGFGTWQPEAFLGMLVTDYRGLLFYMPFLLMGLWVLPRNMNGRELLKDPFILPALVLIVAFLTHATWWAGWTYGPRYIMAGAALLAYATLQRLPPRPLERWSFMVLCGFGMACAWAAKATVWYSLPTGVLHPFNTEIIPRLVRGEWNGAQWPVLWGLPAIASNLAFIVLLISALRILVHLDRTADAPIPLP